MAWTLLFAYLAVAFVVAVAASFASARLGDERRPTGERFVLSLAAGLVWPVLLLGLAEVSSVAMYAKVHEHDGDGASIEVLA